ncbi:MAG: methyltransferase [Pseudomonadota bacterium]|nr:methyltransferase [Pseudomonadota bacterium]
MTTPRPDTVRLQRIAKAHWETGALYAAIDLGVFTHISGGANTFDSLGAAAGIGTRNAMRLLDVLAAMGLVERDAAGRYANTADVERFLVKDKPTYAGTWMTFLRESWGDWNRMADHLQRQETDRLGMYDDLTVESAREYHAATSSIGFGAARKFHRDVDLRGRKRIMDLGGGSGAYCIIAAETIPGIEAVVLDLPPVVEVTREYIAEHGVGDRVSAAACDFTKDPLPTGCDVAIQASNLPIYDTPIIKGLVQRIFDALEPGGEYHLVGEILDDDRMGPIGPALWGLYEAIPGSTGHGHTEAECIGYLEAAGFTGVTATPFVPGTLTRVSGRKPGGA